MKLFAVTALILAGSLVLACSAAPEEGTSDGASALAAPSQAAPLRCDFTMALTLPDGTPGSRPDGVPGTLGAVTIGNGSACSGYLRGPAEDEGLIPMHSCRSAGGVLSISWRDGSDERVRFVLAPDEATITATYLDLPAIDDVRYAGSTATGTCARY